MESPIRLTIMFKGWRETLKELRQLVERRYDSASKAERKRIVQLVQEAEQEMMIVESV
jgi:hypothetical protein